MCSCMPFAQPLAISQECHEGPLRVVESQDASYSASVSCRVNRTAGQKGEGVAFAREVLHWVMAVGAMLCIWAASLAKEIGITVTATIVLYDAFLVPFDRVQPSSGSAAQPKALLH